MPPSALVLVVVGALLHASWNAVAKKAAGGAAFVFLYGCVSLLASAPFLLAAWWRQPQALGAAAWTAVAASAALHVVYSLVLQKGYAASDFSVVYPVARGSGPLLTVVAAIAWLGERPQLAGMAGIGAIVVGIVAMSDLARPGAVASARARAGVGWGVATGACIAGYTLVDGWAIKQLGLDPVLYYALGLLVRTVLMLPQALRSRGRLASEWRAHGRHAVAVGLLSPLAYTLVLMAVARAPLVYVAPAREVSMLMGLFIGAVWLGEPFARRRVAGAAAMVAGVALLATAR